MSLPALPDLATIQDRLARIFPEGTPNRNYCTRQIAARTVFVMLYTGAIEGSGQWLAPKQVTHMSDSQAALLAEEDRIAYRADSMKPRFEHHGLRWYAENTREPIRDETFEPGRRGYHPAGHPDDLQPGPLRPRVRLRELVRSGARR